MTKAEVKAKPELKTIKQDEMPHILNPGEVGAVLELIVTDKDGKVTEKRVMKSESFVRQFLELLFIEFNKVARPAARRMGDINGWPRFIFDDKRNFGCNGGIGDLNRGIIVGTGTTAPTMHDRRLETRILHGTSGGRLEYSAVTFGAPTSDVSISQFTITRNFANGSGADITVNEIGLHVLGREWDGSDYNNRYFLAIRDVISGGIVVPVGQTLTINYRIQTAV